MTGSPPASSARKLIVFLYTLWEDGFRMSFAKAHGCEARDFQVPVLGDLKLMRHDIIHHRSVASSENTGRCQVLRWFKPGEVIRPGASQFFDLVAHFLWEILATGPNTSSDLSKTTAEDREPDSPNLYGRAIRRLWGTD